MRQFRWLSSGDLPDRLDLRRCGWQLCSGSGEEAANAPCPVLVASGAVAPPDWLALLGSGPVERGAALLLDIDNPGERARLLRLGFGDVAESTLGLAELDARLARVAQRAALVPRSLGYGRLTLDLVARDASVAGRRLGLHPREFALLWRLAESVGAAISAIELLSDVWRLSFRPETNSLAVHVSRLRAKLRVAGLDGVVETAQDGGYRLVPPEMAEREPLDGRASELALDASLRIGDQAVAARQDQPT